MDESTLKKTLVVIPQGNQVLVRPLLEDAKTCGGILLPDAARENSLRAEVCAVGKGKVNKKGKRCHIDLKRGQVVWIDRYIGTDIHVFDQPFKLVDYFEHIVAIEE